MPTPIYLDNAATTAPDPQVVEAMTPYFHTHYGNASLSHRLGNSSRTAIEKARTTIKTLLQASGELFFTSGGTESNNWALKGIVAANPIRHLITSPLEHPSVLQTAEHLHKSRQITLHMLPVSPQGVIHYETLDQWLQQYPNALVSLMHGNNEIGNITDLHRVGTLCRKHGAHFHTDIVQTLGYYPIHLDQYPIDSATGSAHKCHGPKGIGFLYIKAGIPIAPLLHGGSQEKALRPGTENTPLIIGFAKALQIATAAQANHHTHARQLKLALMQRIQHTIPQAIFHGTAQHPEASVPHIINIGIPSPKHPETLLLHLDLQQIYASAGSACTSGTTSSHVLSALGIPKQRPVVRLSFSKYNTLAEVDHAAAAIAAWSN